MPYDDIVPRGATKGSKPDAGGAVLRTMPVLAVVKDNIDPVRSGRIRVYVGDFGGLDPNDSTNWVTVSYMTPFYGRTTSSAQKTGYGEFDKNPHSYGVWNSPPDIGTTVICIFINGDPNFGYYIGCVPEPEALQMVPAIGGTDYVIPNAGEANSLGGATRLPVTNLNTNNDNIADSANFLNVPKPIHSYVASTLMQQGLIKDPIRGVIGSSAQRETPSRVGWGVSTPGRPIYAGGYDENSIANAAKSGQDIYGLNVQARRGGHTFVMDDGDILGRDQLIRLRTALGHQILMSDDGQTLFIIHANGQSYIELGKEGTIDMYSTNSVNIRTQGDLNLHADNNININAKKDLNIFAENITTNADKEMAQRVGANFSTSVTGNHTVKVDGGMSLASAGEASVASKSVTFINGSKINLNTGSTGLVPQEVKPLTQVPHTDTLYDNIKGWNAAPAALNSIVSRAPAHAPWVGANKGVDVKVSGSASDALPAAPNPAVQSANTQANNTPTTTPPVTPSVAATVPTNTAISAAVDKNTTAAIVGQTAVAAATGPAADAVKKGAGVVQSENGPVAAIGKMAQSPKQMEDAQYLKAGSSARIDALIASGKSVEEAITPNMFTGKDGINNLDDYIKSKNAQVSAQVNIYQQAQTKLVQSGVITGRESGTQLGGLIMSTATLGLSSTVNFIKNSASSVTGLVSGAANIVSKTANSVLGSVSSMMSLGNKATNLAAGPMSGLSSLTTSITALAKNATSGVTGLFDVTKGLAASAYSSIVASLPKLKANEPNNVKDIAEQAAEKAQATGTNTAQKGLLDSLSGTATRLVSGTVGAITNVVKTAATSVTTTVGNIVAATKTMAGSATGLSMLPGSDKAVATVVNNANNVSTVIPGAESVKNLINTANIPGASSIAAPANTLGTNVLNATNNIGGNLANNLQQLKNGSTSLTQIASAGLPAAAAAELNGAINSLTKNSPIPIRMPVFASNTFSRDGISTQMSSLLGSSKIPLPNYKGNDATNGTTPGESLLEKQTQTLSEIAALTDKNFDLIKTERDARNALSEAKKTLPQGSPELVTLENAYKLAKEAVVANEKQIASLRQRDNTIARSTNNTGDTTGTESV